jgi:hypothetical protein
MNKSKEQIAQEMKASQESKAIEAFLKEFDEITKPIFKKHGYIIQPIIQTNQVGGLNPAFGVGKYKVEEVTPQDPDESIKSETK